MGRESARVRERGRLAEVVERQHPSADGVLEREQPGAREVHVHGFDRRGDPREIDRAVRLVLQRLRLDAAEHRGATLLITVGVRLLADQVLVAAAAVRHQRREVALRPGREQERPLIPEALGRERLQAVHGRIVAVHVVADLGRGHRAAHRVGRPGHGVAAQIDRRACHRRDPPCGGVRI